MALLEIEGAETGSAPRTLRDRAGEAFTVRVIDGTESAALIDFYEFFEPQRGAQGLPPIGRERIARWLAGILGRGIHLAAYRDDTLIGHALIIPLDRPEIAEYAVFLHQTQRGRGVGTELNRVAIEIARSSGFLGLWLSVEPHNRAAIRSYENVGFRFRPATIFSPETEMALELGS